MHRQPHEKGWHWGVHRLIRRPAPISSSISYIPSPSAASTISPLSMPQSFEQKSSEAQDIYRLVVVPDRNKKVAPFHKVVTWLNGIPEQFEIGPIDPDICDADTRRGFPKQR